MSEEPTVSELAFATYCETRGYALRSIPRTSSCTPDFEVRAGSARLIAEVKEFTANDHDREQARALLERGSSGGTFDGRRVRRAIEEASNQLRQFRENHIPTVLFLYDNILVDGKPAYMRCPYFDPTQIEWAMYGQHVVKFNVAARAEPVYVGDHRGGQRKLTEVQGRYISAVAVLAEGGEFAWYFHNYFAAVPLSRAVLSDGRDRHFHNLSNPQASLCGWSELAVRA